MAQTLELMGDARTADGIQAFVPDPAKSLAASTTGTKTFGKAASGYDVNILSFTAIKVRPTADSTYYYNSDTTKTCTLPADTETIIWVGQEGVTSVTLTLGSATAEIQGM